MKEALDHASGEDGEGNAQDEPTTTASAPGGGRGEKESEGGATRRATIDNFTARASAVVGKCPFWPPEENGALSFSLTLITDS